jgi:hypothetical protein
LAVLLLALWPAEASAPEAVPTVAGGYAQIGTRARVIQLPENGMW